MGLRELLGNDISGLDFNSDLTQVEPWASYIYNHVDLPRMRQGGMGGQVITMYKHLRIMHFH